jgi:hypothetical protein
LISTRIFWAIWLIAALYASATIDRGWIPHDEGQFFQTADRVNAGELPHRDFDEMYTGGLTYVHALALRLFGGTFISLRWVLLAAFILWVPAVFYLAQRLVSPWAAAGLTALAVLWSVPNYPAPVPSWYNLFLAVFGAAAVVRFLDTRRTRWLVVAGLCGGLSFLVKLVGLYYAAGVLLFLLLHEQSEAWERAPERPGASRSFSLVLTLGLVAFVSALVSLILAEPTFGSLLIFVVPGAAIAGTLLAREWQLPPGSARQRAVVLIRLLTPFLVGVALPIALYGLAFALAGGLGDLYHGLFVAPKQRLEFASFPTPAFSIRRCGPILLLVAIAMTRWRSTRLTRAGVALVAVLLAAMLVLSAYVPSMYLTSWRPVVFVLAIVAVAGAWRFRVPGALTTDQQVRALVIFVTATATLVQYPFPAPVYFCYVAPIVGLAAAAAASSGGRMAHPLAGLLLIFYILFAAVRLAPGFIYRMGRSYEPVTLNSAIAAPRAKGIRVSADEARTYNRVLALVSEHSRGGAIYASPDAPEIYVLAEAPYPGRTIYEFLADPTLSDAAVLEHLSRDNVRVVVIKKNPRFSDPLSPGLLAELRTRYPLGETVDTFEVLWKE